MFIMLRFRLVVTLVAVTYVQSSVLTGERVKRQLPSFFDPFGVFDRAGKVLQGGIENAGKVVNNINEGFQNLQEDFAENIQNVKEDVEAKVNDVHDGFKQVVQAAEQVRQDISENMKLPTKVELSPAQQQDPTATDTDHVWWKTNPDEINQSAPQTQLQDVGPETRVADSGDGSIVTAVLKLIGLDKISLNKLAMNVIMYVIEMVASSFLDTELNEIPDTRSDESPILKFLKHGPTRKIMEMLEEAQNPNLPQHIIDILKRDNDDSACVQLLICKISPIIWGLQSSVGEVAYSGFSRSFNDAVKVNMPSMKELLGYSDQCDSSFPKCNLKQHFKRKPE